jgi:hypothetical protein
MGKRIMWLLAAIGCLAVWGCTQPSAEEICELQAGGQKYHMQLAGEGPHNYALQTLKDSSDTVWTTWPVPYEVYHASCGDIDADGNDDVILGVVKSTRYDTTMAKRLFILKVVDGHLRPLWLGSGVAHRLQDVRLQQQNGRTLVRTLERANDGTWLVGLYYWYGFGLVLQEYSYRQHNEDEAHNVFLAN